MKSAIITHIVSFSIFVVISIILIYGFAGRIDVTDIPESEEIEETTQSVIHFETKEDDVSDIDHPKEETSENKETDATEPESYILQNSLDGELKYLNDVVFLGDNTIRLMMHYPYIGLPDPARQVWTVDEDISTTQIMSVNNFQAPGIKEPTTYLSAVIAQSPLYLVLSFGTYDNGEELDKETFISAYGNFIVNIKSASPKTNLIIQSIFPVSEDCEIITPEEVKERNEWLKELCKTYEVHYLDTYSMLSDENGIIHVKYRTADGYMLNELGYNEVIYYVRTHVHPSFRAHE